MPILHKKVSLIASTGDPSLVQPQDWNNDHNISGTLDLSGVTGILGGLIPNTPIAFSATPNFPVSTNASYSMTLTGNVTSSTTSGTPINGQLLSLTLTQDGVGGHTFSFPANFVLPPSFSFTTTAAAINEVTFKFDGTNWHLISNSGGAGGGANPAGNQGDVQSRNGAALQASSINDNGSRVNVGNDTHFKGLNPNVDITLFGARAVTTVPQTTATMSGGSANVTLGAASTFVNGDGVVVRGAGATLAISTPTAPTVVASNAQVLTGTGLVVTNTSGATTYQYCIAARTTDGQLTPCSANTTITNGPATLGSTTINISSWTRSASTVTVTLASNHNMVAGSVVTIYGTDLTIVGTWPVVTATPGTSTFTFNTIQSTVNGATTSGGSAGTVTYYNANHITWSHVTNAWQYYIYGRTAGSMALLGVSYPDNTAFAGFPTNNMWDDFGPTMSTAPPVPDWVPSTPPVSGKNGDLVTTIVSGAGTTSLVLANTATNAVAGATLLQDNTPNIKAALTFANGQSAIYIPATGSGSVSFFTNSFLQFPDFPIPWVYQAGQLVLNDTVAIGRQNWVGVTVPQAKPAFSHWALPNILGGNAFPMFLENNGNAGGTFSFVNISVPANGMGYLQDNGGIPSVWFDHVQMSGGGSTDYMGMLFVLRGNNPTGGAGNNKFKDCSFIANQGLISLTPVVYFSIMGNPVVFTNPFFSGRGVLFTAGGNGLLVEVDNSYTQGPSMPMFTSYISTGNVNFLATIKGAISDTPLNGNQPLWTNLGNFQGTLKVSDTETIPLLTGNFLALAAASYKDSSPFQNINSESGTTIATSIDGVLSNSSSGFNYGIKRLNAGLGLGNPYQVHFNSLPQPAPTCAVSAGGSVALGSYFFKVAPSFPTGGSSTTFQGEGTVSPASTSCTTTGGNQTITINWTTIPAATGYDIYLSSDGGQTFISLGCTAGFVGATATSYVWSSVTPCGPGQPSIPGTGPVSMTATSVNSPQFKLVASDGTGTHTTSTSALTANRTETKPDASGTTVLDSTLITTAKGLSPTYDNFNRANNPIGTGSPFTWTIPSGTVVTSSNLATGSTGGVHNIAVVTGSNIGNDYFVEATYVGSNSQQQALTVRQASSNANGFECTILASGGGHQISRDNNAVFTNLASDAVAAVSGDVIRCQVIGNTITYFVNGVQILQATDSGFPTGFPGMRFFGNATGTFDNFNIGFINQSFARLNQEANWTAPQHFTYPVTVGIPEPIDGTLASNTLYAQNLVLGARGAQSTSVNAISGNSGRLGQTSGTLTSGNLASYDANGNLIDSGNSSTTFDVLSSITAATASNSINSGDNSQVWNWALTTAGKTAFKFGENTAATGANDFLLQAGTQSGSTAIPFNVFSTLSGSQTLPTLSVTPTWNTTGVVDAALLVNATNTASGAGSLLADFQLSSTSQWKVDKAGNTTQVGTASLGTSPPACTPGTAGGTCINEGTAPTAGANYDTIYADSTQHAISVNNNNTGNMAVSRVTCVNVSPVTVNANVSSDQNLMSCTLSANLLNVVGRTLKVWTASLYSTPAASVATITNKLKLCTVSGCGSGTVIVLATYGSSANPGTVTNNQVNTSTYVTTQTAGAASVQESHGNMVIDLGASPTVADSSFADTNTATTGAIDSTAQLFLQVTGTFSVASASNSMTQRQLIVEVLN